MKPKKTILLLMMLVASLGITAQDDGFSVSAISDEVFTRMQGRSFPEGCTTKREDLRYLRLMYCDADGKTHSGEMVCNKNIAQDLIEIFRELYKARYPIERIALIDDYDADDEASMTANNTSCFCFRNVSGSKSLSNHARGLAVDINPLYNPYIRTLKDGTIKIEPAAGKPYANRKKDSRYKLRKGDLCHRLFMEHGFKWGGDWKTMKDYQHFEKK